MRFCLNLPVYIFWLLPPKHVLVMGQDYELVTRLNIPVESPSFLKGYKKGNFTCILVSSSSAIYWLNSTILTHPFPKILVEPLVEPKEVLFVEDDVFPFPAFVIAHGSETRFVQGGLVAVDITDFSDVQTFQISPNERHAYDIPAFVSRKEIVVHRFNMVSEKGYKDELTYLTHDENSTYEWQSKTMNGSWANVRVSNIKTAGAWRYFTALFGILAKNNLIMLTTSSGEISDDNITMVKVGSNDVANIEMIDMNLDEKLDLLVTSENNDGDLEVYELPLKHLFSYLDKYRKHKILSNFNGKKKCPSIMKPFYPAAKYVGKPWILLAGPLCTKASYLVPLRKEPKDWNYKEVEIMKDLKSSAGIEALDIDGDGFTEVFVSQKVEGHIKVFSFKEVVIASSCVTFELSLVFITFCHVIDIFLNFY